MSIFSQIPIPKIARSTHKLNHTYQMTGDFGGIYPILTELAFAGDTWKFDLEQFVRSMPMIAPIMSMVDIKVDAFFCPIRLIWDDFEDWVTLGPTGEATFDWPTIRINQTNLTQSSATSINQLFYTGGLADYLNFPTFKSFATLGQDFSRELDALPFRTYQIIYNEYYRNENLDSEIPVIKTSGSTLLNFNSASSGYINHFKLRYRGWNKDYYTSALPFPQKGPAVRMPAGGDVVISGKQNTPLKVSGTKVQGSTLTGNVGVTSNSSPSHTEFESSLTAKTEIEGTPSDDSLLYYEDGLQGEIVGLNGPTIEELRYAEVLQEFYEANARGGSRPKEYYLNIWHTRTKDSRLDRPEYLGGYRGPITITDIDQTSQSDISAQATPAGKGVSAGGNRLVRYHCSEHGYIMVLVSITPRSSYSQGFRKMNLYRDVFDFPNPFFANLGEQEIKNSEIYDNPDDGLNDNTFGYTPRYAEAKFIPSTVHGQLRTSLNYWTTTRLFLARPNLNSAFVHINPDEMSRIFPSQVTNNDKFVATFYFKVKRRMYLPYWGVPRLIHSI